MKHIFTISLLSLLLSITACSMGKSQREKDMEMQEQQQSEMEKQEQMDQTTNEPVDESHQIDTTDESVQ